MAKGFTPPKTSKRTLVYTLEQRKKKINALYIKRAIQKTKDYDEQINKLRIEIDEIEYGSFNKTLTNRISYSYKDLVYLKNIKYKSKL